MNKQLSVENPGARASCGCGTSFAFGSLIVVVCLVRFSLYAKKKKDVSNKEKLDKDWFGVCLHGLSFDKTFTYFHYGYNSR